MEDSPFGSSSLSHVGRVFDNKIYNAASTSSNLKKHVKLLSIEERLTRSKTKKNEIRLERFHSRPFTSKKLNVETKKIIGGMSYRPFTSDADINNEQNEETRRSREARAAVDPGYVKMLCDKRALLGSRAGKSISRKMERKRMKWETLKENGEGDFFKVDSQPWWSVQAEEEDLIDPKIKYTREYNKSFDIFPDPVVNLEGY